MEPIQQPNNEGRQARYSVREIIAPDGRIKIKRQKYYVSTQREWHKTKSLPNIVRNLSIEDQQRVREFIDNLHK